MYISLTELGEYTKKCPLTYGVTSTLAMMDDEYYIPELSDVRHMIDGYLNRLAELQVHYTPNLFDCDGFAKALAAFASLQAVKDGVVRAPWPCALITGYTSQGPHAMCLFLVRRQVNGEDVVEWVLVEAQTGDVFYQESMAGIISHVSLAVF